MRSALLLLAAMMAGITAMLALAPLPAVAQSEITFQLENDTFTHPTSAATLRDVLAELGMELPGDYLAELHLNLDGKPPPLVTLPRLAVVRVERRETVSPPIEYKQLPTQDEPRIGVIDAGAPGERIVSATFFYLAGEPAGGRRRAEWLRKPRTRIIAIYHAVEESYLPSIEEILGIDKDTALKFKPPVVYKRKLTMEATAFDPTVGGTDPHAATAGGYKAKYGIVAVDPHVIPLDTRLYIEGYGYAVAGDVGGAIKGNKIDLCFDTIKECYAFGRRDVVVYILD
jgi:3D (Asp-Asp-Asp) domain-containing protein